MRKDIDMFKKYKMSWKCQEGDEVEVDFFVNRKKTKNGFMHRACVIGQLPRLDDTETNWQRYRQDDEKLNKKRICKLSYCNRTWEEWPGKECLKRLWEGLDKLNFLDMARIALGNPFGNNAEPCHEDIDEADEIFRRFS